MRSWIAIPVAGALACGGGMHPQAPVPTPAAPAPAPAVTTGRAAGAEVVTAADVRRRIFIVADDSLRGRATPSADRKSVV